MENYHDKWMDLLFREYAKCTKERAVNGFLSGLNSGNKYLRSGLPVIAIMQTFPKHNFQLREEQLLSIVSPCGICSSYYGAPEIIDEERESAYFNTGGLLRHSVDTYYSYLKQFNELEEVPVPEPESFAVFFEILDIILSAEQEETLKKDVLKKIRKLKQLNSNAREVQMLLETLGYCGIFESDKHKGALDRYTNLAVAPRKSHSSDWKYPVDFWLGKDRINKKAFEFWFGKFEPLERYWK
ncbi:hypothetical protein AGMMS49983_13960 [Clostridia bacterium]|nr:hypothetical protein AGMMS49983_13960 [Clostridia bacterium]